MRKKVLVVDDEDDVVKLLELVLSRNGFDVVAARNGIDGLMMVQRERPDLVLLDIMMEGMDGWEVLKLLRLEEETRHLPVVILSARAEPRDKVRGLQEGALDYITKPFGVRKLLGTIEAILGNLGEGPR